MTSATATGPGPGPAADPQPPAADADHLARIKTLTEAVRATWFSYLGLLGFVAVTLFGVRDIDFFVPGGGTELPLVGVSVPTTVFFLGAAILVAAVYVYLHVYLEQLWYHLGRAEARLDGRMLAERVHPWLGTEMALHLRQRLRRNVPRPGDGPEPPCCEGSPLGAVGVLATGALLIVAGPLLLFWLWIRSMPAHDFWWLTAPIAVCLWLAVWTMWAGIGAMRDKLGPWWQIPAWRRLSFPVLHVRGGNRPAPGRQGVMPVVLVALLVVSGLRTEWDRRELAPRPAPDAAALDRAAHWFRPAGADLTEARLVVDGAAVTRHEHVRRDFYAEWCRRPDTPTACAAGIPVAGPFHDEFVARRADQLRAGAIRLAGTDLAFANLQRVTGHGLDLRSADLTLANLSSAVLEAADFTRFGQGDPARLRGADLDFADLTGASLDGADMTGTSLNRTNLASATLTRAVLPNALLLQPDLRGADLGSAILRGALISGGDFAVQLPEGTAPEHSDGLYNAEVLQLGNDLHIEESFLPLRPAAFADSETRFGVGGFELAAFRFVDMDALGLSPLGGAFFDGSVNATRFGPFPRSCQAAEEVLGDRDFFGRWRGWLELNGRTWPPSDAIGNLRIVDQINFAEPFAGAGYETRTVAHMRARDVPAIPPPDDCAPIYTAGD